MFCPSCGARDQAPGSACAECGRALPSARTPAAVAEVRGAPLPEAPATVADRPARAPPTFADRSAPATVADRPSAAPAEPPRILRRPAPLAPAPVDVVPRNPAPPPRIAANAAAPAQVRRPTATAQQAIDPDGPTQIRRPPGFEERMVSDVVRAPPRRETPAAVEGVGARAAPRPAAPAPAAAAPLASLPPVLTSAGVEASVLEPGRATVPARPPPPRPVQPPPLPPPTAPAFVLPPEPPAPAEPDTASTAAVPLPARALPPSVLVLGSGARLALARGTDALITAALAAVVLYASLLALGVRPAVQPIVDAAHGNPVALAVTLLGAPFVAVALYQALGVLLLGATVGGRLAGLRVVRMRDGAKPGALRALVRAALSALGTIAFGSGPLWGLLIDRRRRGLGDLVARCVTVRASAGGDA